ncbi:MAG: flagellar hook protein FlgE [Pseudomonadota bacterium]
MSFQQGLSGLSAASRSLDVIGNNIANANTTGMKSSRAEFSGLYATSLNGGGGSTSPGIGVSTDAIAQQFTQGNLSTTGNDLDLGINGSGFYMVQTPSGDVVYSRAGNFKLDPQGNIITNSGAKLQGNIIDPVTGGITKGSLSVPTNQGIAGKQTTDITAALNLDTTAIVASSVTPPTPVTTYGTSLNVYDSQGAAIPVSLYFQKTAANTWDVYADYPTGATPSTTMSAPVGTVTFDAAGKLLTPAGGTISLPGLQVAGAATPAFVPAPTVDVSAMTQSASSFFVSSLKQDGYAPGEYTGMKFADDGTLSATFSNGQTQTVGQIVLANFTNVQGLEPTSGGYWKETVASGAPLKNTPGAGNFGKIAPGSLEDSNVDLTAELVNMMTAQRAYQANAQTIKTQDQVMSTLVNMR